MNFIAAILLLLSTALVYSAETVVSLDYCNNRGNPNTQVTITVDSEGISTVTTDSKNEGKATRRIQIPLKKFHDMKQELEALDWKKVLADKIEGRDGTSVQISYGKQSASLWSPDYDSQNRGLSRIQKVIETMLDLSGLDGTGRPK